MGHLDRAHKQPVADAISGKAHPANALRASGQNLCQHGYRGQRQCPERSQFQRAKALRHLRFLFNEINGRFRRLRHIKVLIPLGQNLSLRAYQFLAYRREKPLVLQLWVDAGHPMFTQQHGELAIRIVKIVGPLAQPDVVQLHRQLVSGTAGLGPDHRVA